MLIASRELLAGKIDCVVRRGEEDVHVTRFRAPQTLRTLLLASAFVTTRKRRDLGCKRLAPLANGRNGMSLNALGFHSEKRTPPRFAGASYPPLHAKPSSMLPPLPTHYPSEAPPLPSAAGSTPTRERLVAGRVEYLEVEQKRANDALVQCDTKVDALRADVHAAYDEAHAVFARATEDLPGTDDLAGSEAGAAIVAKSGELLARLPARARRDRRGERVRMRCKTVHPATGQLSLTWVTVYEKQGAVHVRRIGDFSVHPL